VKFRNLDTVFLVRQKSRISSIKWQSVFLTGAEFEVAGQISSLKSLRQTSRLLVGHPSENGQVSRCLKQDKLVLEFYGIPRGKVRAVGVMENQRTHAGLRVHHEAFRQLHADFFGLQ